MSVDPPRGQVILATPRCILRGVTAADLPALRGLATAPEAARMLILFHPAMTDDAFAAIFPPFAGRPPFRAVIEMDGRVAGSIGVGDGEEPMVYYFLAPGTRGQGIASEVLTAAMAWAAAHAPIRAFRAEVFADNPASIRVLEKAGFATLGPVMLASAGRDDPAPALLMRRPL